MRFRALLGVLAWWAAVSAAAQPPAQSQPTTGTVPSNQARLNDLIGLIEGQNAPEVRRTVARELLLQRWPETPPRLVSLLGGVNSAAKVAVAGALAELPELLDPVYIEPLIAMLGDADAAVRQAAATVLAAYPDNGVTVRLRQLALDADTARLTRLAAITALGLMTEREAIDALVAVLAVSDAAISQAALAALSQATAMDFSDDPAAARAWWEETRALSREAWQQHQIERLVRKHREMRRRVETLESRLGKVVEGSFLRVADAERAALLAGYLADSTPTFRLLGLKLTQLHLAEGRSLPPELQDRVRELLAGAADPREQAAAVQAVASLRDSQDASRFLDMLARTRAREVRLALLNGLGYIGGPAAIDALFAFLSDPDDALVTEAVAALGRLAERGVITEGTREIVASALLDVFGHSGPANAALRERVLWAMGNLADPRLAPVAAAALDRQETVAVRQAAVRCLAAIKSPQFADALLPATGDPDPGVRRVAVETLAAIGSSANDSHVQALWERAGSTQETEETIRQLAWRGVLDLLSRGSPEDAERWMARLPTSGTTDAARTLELLERLARAAADTDPIDHARLGRIRARLAGQYARLGQPAEAINAYIAAIDDLEAARAEGLDRVALDLLRCAIASGQYDARIADLLGRFNSQADTAEFWRAVKAEVEPRLTPDGVDQALAILTAVEAHPPGAWPTEISRELAQLRERALRLKQPAEPAETQPSRTAMSSQP